MLPPVSIRTPPHHHRRPSMCPTCSTICTLHLPCPNLPNCLHQLGGSMAIGLPPCMAKFSLGWTFTIRHLFCFRLQKGLKLDPVGSTVRHFQSEKFMLQILGTLNRALLSKKLMQKSNFMGQSMFFIICIGKSKQGTV